MFTVLPLHSENNCPIKENFSISSIALVLQNILVLITRETFVYL